jgi:hypothetical protein
MRARAPAPSSRERRSSDPPPRALRCLRIAPVRLLAVSDDGPRTDDREAIDDLLRAALEQNIAAIGRDVEFWRQATRPRVSVPRVVVRLAVETVLFIAVSVIVGIGNFRPLVIVVLMGAAVLAIVVAESLAARSVFVPPVSKQRHRDQ